jgi:hypothetical protein
MCCDSVRLTRGRGREGASQVPNSFGRHCAQCGADMIAPELLEYLTTGCVRHVWTCEASGHNAEDSIDFSVPLEG